MDHGHPQYERHGRESASGTGCDGDVWREPAGAWPGDGGTDEVPNGPPAGLADAGAPAAGGAFAGNPVLEWNQVALDAVRHYSFESPPEDPPYVSRALAIESIAVLDTVRALEGRDGYLVDEDAPSGASLDAAVAAAAHDTLTSLFPDYAAALAQEYREALDAVPDGDAEDAGVALGREVAEAVLQARAQDGSDPHGHLGPVAGEGLGGYVPTGPDHLDALQPGWGGVDPFSLLSGDQFRAPPPPDPASPEYAADYRQVQELGGAGSETRTPEQAEIALWWANDEASYTRVGQWNDIADHLAADNGLDASGSARLLAELNVAVADTLIAGWDTKYAYESWRPVTAIRDGDADGNPGTAGDPAWDSFLPSPNHPDYVSGHAVIGAAAAKVMADVFGEVPFSGTSETSDQVRAFEGFAQAAREEADSRVYAGVHFPFASEAGLVVGEQVGDWVVGDFHQRFGPPAQDGTLLA